MVDSTETDASVKAARLTRLNELAKDRNKRSCSGGRIGCTNLTGTAISLRNQKKKLHLWVYEKEFIGKHGSATVQHRVKGKNRRY